MHDDRNPLLKSLLRTPVAEAAPSDDESGLPPQDERQYAPHARPANRPLYSIHFADPAGNIHSFQYVHLDSHSTYSAGCVTLKFLGMEPVRVVIRGRNLWRLYDYIHQHRMPWVMQAARDFAEDGQTVITGVSFTAVKADE